MCKICFSNYSPDNRRANKYRVPAFFTKAGFNNICLFVKTYHFIQGFPANKRIVDILKKTGMPRRNKLQAGLQGVKPTQGWLVVYNHFYVL